MVYDLIVIGAGPAGAAAAAEAASRGMRVLLLEKRVLPRHKTCGGGMPMSVGALVRDLAPEAFVECEVRYMRHTWRFGEAVLGEVNPPGSGHEIRLWMARRSVFDNALAQRASRLGAELRDGQAVRAIEIEPDRTVVRALSESGAESAWSAHHVLGADGANGMTARAAGLRRNRSLAIGMEVEAPFRWAGAHESVRPDTLHLEYGVVRRGYAWVFPKGDHLNVGAGLFRPSAAGRGDADVGEALRRAILGYLEALRVPHDPQGLRFHAHPLPLWSGKERLHSRDGRILLAGDAAGLINPLFGDGILHAVKSGIIAATAIAEDAPAEYTRRIHAEFASSFEAARRLAGPFYHLARPVFRHLVSRPDATRAAARLLSGDAPFTSAAQRTLRLLRRASGMP